MSGHSILFAFSFNLVYNIHARKHLAKHNMVAIQPFKKNKCLHVSLETSLGQLNRTVFGTNSCLPRTPFNYIWQQQNRILKTLSNAIIVSEHGGTGLIKDRHTYQLVTTVVMKNCDPLVSGPAFAIDSIPVCKVEFRLLEFYGASWRLQLSCSF